MDVMDRVEVPMADGSQDLTEEVVPVLGSVVGDRSQDNNILSKNPWLALLLSEIQRRASRRRLSNEPSFCLNSDYFCQWGTPQDLGDYNFWTNSILGIKQ